MAHNNDFGDSAGNSDSGIKQRIFLVATLGVVAAVIFFSMLAKPEFYAMLMGAKRASYSASTGSLVRVAADLSPSPAYPSPTSPPPTYTPYPIPSSTITPFLTGFVTNSPTPKLTVSPAQVQVLQSRLEANVDQGGVISDWNFDVYYSCYGTNGYPTVAGSFRYKMIGTVENVANVPLDNSCKFQVTRLPSANVGYSWSDPNFQTSTRYENAATRNQNKYQTTFLDIRLKKIATVSAPITQTPTYTPTPPQVYMYNLIPQTPFVPGGGGKVQLTKLPTPTSTPLPSVSQNSQVYRIISASFTGLVPTRQYRIHLCDALLMCSPNYNSNAIITADANGNASSGITYDIVIYRPVVQIQLRQINLYPDNPPSCRDTACMMANL